MTTLQVIDTRLAKYRAIVDELTALRAEVSATIPAVETLYAPPPKVVPPGNRKPAQSTVAVRAKAARGSAPKLAEERRLKVAHMLAAEHLTTAQIAERLPLASSQVSELMRGRPFFTKGTNRLSPWELTPSGRAALASPVPNTSG